MVFSNSLILRLRSFFLTFPYVSHLSMDSLFALISKMCPFGVLKAETDFYLFDTPLTRRVVTVPCVVWASTSQKEVNKFTKTIFRCAADYGTGFGLAFYVHVFTEAVLKTPIIETVVCPLLVQRFYVIVTQLNSKRDIGLFNCHQLLLAISF